MYVLQECITGGDKGGASLCLESGTVLLNGASGLVHGFIYLLYKILPGQGKQDGIWRTDKGWEMGCEQAHRGFACVRGSLWELLWAVKVGSRRVLCSDP